MAVRRAGIFALLSLGYVAWDADVPAPRVAGALRSDPARAGVIDVLTYNVAGLPGPLSASRPATHSRWIAPRLDAYDIVLLQEDFAYHDVLVGLARHAFVAPPGRATRGLFGDGLSRLSVFPIRDHARQRWRACHGYVTGCSDCLADKGFTVAFHDLGRGRGVDVYDVHLDAGDLDGDRLARRVGIAQLADEIACRSDGRAVIVAGDFNLCPDRGSDGVALRAECARLGLVDVAIALGHADDGIDRVLFRPGVGVALRPIAWRRADEFVTPDGAPLSDHVAIHVRFALGG